VDRLLRVCLEVVLIARHQCRAPSLNGDSLPSMSFAAGYSRSAINRAGASLRNFWVGDQPPTDEVVAAFVTMIAFRETFQEPLRKTAIGLRSMVKSECPALRIPGAHIPVVQRLKRREQILRKLARFPDSQLSNMGDIGGCRAVLQTREEVEGVLRRIRRNWQVHGRIRDTRDEPTDTGYRALHVIVVRDGRRVEIQLRTPHEHEWAVAVERTGMRLGYGLKEGEGPADLLEYFRLAGQGLYLESIGSDADPRLMSDFLVMQERVRPYFPN
jgi:putative GTP pyrophosphokinase